MTRSQSEVVDLVSMIEQGKLRLPEMQRRYVWRAPRVRDLLDSLYRGYPSGNILMWETDEEVPEQDFSVGQKSNPYQTTLLLLDGQQRLTSLSAVIRGEPVSVKGRKRPIEILFNLEHPEGLSFVTEVNEEEDDDLIEDEEDSSVDHIEERLQAMTFVVATKRLENMPHWVKVSDVFSSTSDAPFLKNAGVNDFEDPRYSKYSDRLKRLRAIKNYQYRLDILQKDMSYEEVTEIFVRVNSLGAKLRGSDLALAQITSKWPGSLEIFRTFSVECAKLGFPLDLGVHVKSLVAFATGQSRFKTVGSLTIERLEESWESHKKGFEFAINFLKAGGITSPALLSSPFLIISLAFHGHREGSEFSPTEAAALRNWMLLANAKGRYTRGSSESLLDQDLNITKSGGDAAALLERLRNQVGRLHFEASELDGRRSRSAAFKTMFLAFKQQQARDWFSQLEIAIDHAGAQHKLQFHHIFAQALLKGKYPPGEVNDIANLAFIGGKTNRKLGAKPPSTYLPGLAETDPELLRTQCIPEDPELWKLENFPDFLAARREMITECLNEFLGVGHSKAN